MYRHKFTIFTPTYNRSHTLERLYLSLKRQTMGNFEWLIIDDGSTDSTNEVINNFADEKNTFPIRYFVQPHGGKHRAVNRGLDLAEGELFFMLDSDDYITDDALERITYWENLIDDKSKYAGLYGRVGFDDDTSITPSFDGPYLDIPMTSQFKHRLNGDFAKVLYTDLFKKYKYPEFENEWHIAPTVPFVRMAKDDYLTRYFNEIIYVAEYLEDGLTKMGDRKIFENFCGYTLRTREFLNTEITWKRKIELIGKYTHLARQKGRTYSWISKEIKVTTILCATLGLIAKIHSKLTALQSSN